MLMRRILSVFCAICVLSLLSCHLSLDERIRKETEAYRLKECPKPMDECTVLDSLSYTFGNGVRTHACYYTLSGFMDNDSCYVPQVVESFRESVLQDIRTNLLYKRLREHGVTFEFHYRSASQPDKEYVHLTFTPEEYK